MFRRMKEITYSWTCWWQTSNPKENWGKPKLYYVLYILL